MKNLTKYIATGLIAMGVIYSQAYAKELVPEGPYQNPEYSAKTEVVNNVMNQVDNNTNWKKDVVTGARSQMTAMDINPKTNPNNEVGFEIHDGFDQMIYVVSGDAKVVTGNQGSEQIDTIHQGDLVSIPANTRHNVINLNKDKSLKILSFYSLYDTKVNKAYPTSQSMKQ